MTGGPPDSRGRHAPRGRSRGVTRRTILGAAAALPAAALLGGCTLPGRADPTAPDLRMVADPEIRPLARLAQDQAAGLGYRLAVDYQGQPAMFATLADPDHRYDLVWPTTSLMTMLASPGRPLGEPTLVAQCPVVWAVKRSVAGRFGWLDRTVGVADLLAAVTAPEDAWRYAMAGATHIGGATGALHGLLAGFSGAGASYTLADLDRQQVTGSLIPTLRRVTRSAPDAAGLSALVADRYDGFELLVTTQVEAVAVDRVLVGSGREPMHVLYPTDAQVALDAPLYAVEGDDAARRERAVRVQGAMRVAEIRQAISDTGWYPTIGAGVRPSPASYPAEWGVGTGWRGQLLGAPDPATWREAMTRYRRSWRKPSVTVLAIDRSGSVEDDGLERLQAGLGAVLLPAQTTVSWAQPSPEDLTLVIPFTETAGEPLVIRGDDADDAAWVAGRIDALPAGGGTDLYEMTRRGLWAIEDAGLGDRLGAVILITDGQSNEGELAMVEDAFADSPIGPAVAAHAVLVGDAWTEQVEPIVAVSGGEVFEGTRDLATALRTARGGN